MEQSLGFLFIFGALDMIIISIITGYIISDPYAVLVGSFLLVFIGAFFLFAAYTS